MQSEVFKDWPDAPVLAKPASHDQIVAAVARLLTAARPTDVPVASAVTSEGAS
jgi:hypothetical protein